MKTRKQIHSRFEAMHRELRISRNNPELAGQLAGRKEFFGPNSRFAVAPVHTRFEAIEWFVWDSEQIDDVTNGPKVIRQVATRALAIEGIDVPYCENCEKPGSDCGCDPGLFS